MDQIRFDILSAQPASSYGRNTGAAQNDAGDAFAQMLDQQIAKRKDEADGAPPPQSGRSTSQDRVQNDSSAPRPPRTVKRRDASSGTQAVATRSDPARTKAATNPPAAAEARNAAKESDKAKDNAVAAPAGSTTASSGSDTAASKDTQTQTGSGDGSDAQQQGAAQTEATCDGKTSDATPVAAPMLTPVALPTDDAATSATDPATAAANAKLIAAQAALAATALPLTGAATGQAQQTPDTAGGLKFGAVLADGRNAQGQRAASLPDAAGLGAGDDAQAEADPDPMQAGGPAAGEAQLQAPQTPGAAKPRGASAQTTAPTAVASVQVGKTLAATAVQPANAGSGAAWPGAGSGTPVVDALTLGDQAESGGNNELSSWSQYLGSGSADGLAAAANPRQAAFIAQLKQNLQIVPAHEQIAVQIQNAMKNGSSRLTVDLQPAELGRVEIKLEVDKDKNVSAQVVVDRPATLDLLQRDAKALERALQDAGLQTGQGSLSFSLRDTGGQGGGYGQAERGGGSAGMGGTGTAGSETASQPARPDVIATADGYVDVKT